MTAGRLILLVKHGTGIQAVETTDDPKYAAEFLELSPAEFDAMLEEHGRVDTDTAICLPWEP
jgi:hypothetical protein